MIRSYDFTNLAEVKETILGDPASLEKVPKPILDVLPAVRSVPIEPPASVRP